MSVPEKHPVKTRIVVLEEHPLLRHGIAHLLNSQEDMIVCGETDNIRDALHKIQELKPHLLLTALRLGTGDSLEFLKSAQIGASCFVDSRLFRFRGNHLRRACFPCRRGGLRDEKSAKGRVAHCDSRNFEREHLCQPRRGDARIQKIPRDAIRTTTALGASYDWH